MFSFIISYLKLSKKWASDLCLWPGNASLCVSVCVCEGGGEENVSEWVWVRCG